MSPGLTMHENLAFPLSHWCGSPDSALISHLLFLQRADGKGKLRHTGLQALLLPYVSSNCQVEGWKVTFLHLLMRQNQLI